MNLLNCVLFGVILTLLAPVSSKRTFGGRHSYPKSGGLSGGSHGLLPSFISSKHSFSGSHNYPKSSGLSGGLNPVSRNRGFGGHHSYPKSSGLSGGGPGGGHGYPSSSSRHSYLYSAGKTASLGHAHVNPSVKNHGYPHSSGLSGVGHGYPGNRPTGYHTANVYKNYRYSPPAQIRYAAIPGAAPVSYPVYRGQPPSYVYQYKNSGSKYGTLLAGLALMNLGTFGIASYAAHKSNQNQGNYKPEKGEVCKFVVEQADGDYEETKIDCQIISGIIGQDKDTENSANHSTITTMTNRTLVNALDVKGTPVAVTPGMKCIVIRNSPTSNLRKTVPCGLLQTYANQSLGRSSTARNVPMLTIVVAVLAYCVQS